MNNVLILLRKLCFDSNSIQIASAVLYIHACIHAAIGDGTNSTQPCLQAG